MKQNYDIIIVGAGMAGLACAQKCSESNQDFLLIEKSDRIGGRVGSLKNDGFVFDIGFQVYNTAYEVTNKLLRNKLDDFLPFLPGAKIISGKNSTIISDPMRNFSKVFHTIFSSAGSFKDKIKILTLKYQLSNYSIDFDAASSDEFNCGYIPQTNEGDISFSAWCNVTATGTYQAILSSTDTGGKAGINIVIRNDGNIKFERNQDTSNTRNNTGYTVTGFSFGSWNHLCGTFNSTTGELKAYINGVLQATSFNTGGGASPTDDLHIGIMSDSTFFPANGSISNVAIFNSILNQEEVLDVYNNGIPTNLNTSFTPGPPEYWWPMDEDHTYFNGSVLIARDAVGSTDATGVNVIQENIVGNAPGSEANGVGSNLTIADLKGNMQNSTNNSYSINMADYADGVTNPADSGRSTNVP